MKRSECVRVTWEVEDGYVGGSAPHYTDIPLEDYQACESDEERDSLVGNYVREDFEQTIAFAIKRIEVPGVPAHRAPGGRG